MASFLAVDGPPDQLWLPRMVRFTVSGPPNSFATTTLCIKCWGQSVYLFPIRLTGHQQEVFYPVITLLTLTVYHKVYHVESVRESTASSMDEEWSFNWLGQVIVVCYSQIILYLYQKTVVWKCACSYWFSGTCSLNISLCMSMWHGHNTDT